MGKRSNSPFAILQQLEREMHRLGADAMQSVFFQPRADVYETADSVVLKVELAGVRLDSLSITLSADDRTLKISGSRTEVAADCCDRVLCHQLEIYYGEFERDVALPRGVPIDRESLSANYKDGILVISARKRQNRNNKRSIQVTD